MTGNQRVMEGRARRIDGASAIAVGRTQVAKSVIQLPARCRSVGRSVAMQRQHRFLLLARGSRQKRGCGPSTASTASPPRDCDIDTQHG